MEEVRYIHENPWRGLQSYREGEILYGRDDDIRDLSQCVLREKYTLLYGKSGIGKSSILNAAIIPALRRHGYTPIVLRFSHKEGDYIEQIHKAIAEVLGDTGIHEDFKRKGDKESLYEYMHRHTFWNNDNSRAKLFLLFDQFEEIFTLQTDEVIKKEFFSQLAYQCNNILPDDLQPTSYNEPVEEKASITDHLHSQQVSDTLDDIEFDLPNLDFAEYIEDNEIRMIFTIREDFLSEFDYYTAAIPLLKHNRYYLRPINEEQASQIIMRPYPGLVSEKDAWLIISKVTNRSDFKIDGNPELTVDSAVLSLYLSRLFEARHNNEPITASLIEQKGGEIIADFYRDAIAAVAAPSIDYLEENLITGQGRRDNITTFDALHDGHVSDKELNILIDEKKILRRFNYAGDLRIEYVHDILCPVVVAHREERRMELQQAKEHMRLLAEQEAERKRIEKHAKEEQERLEREKAQIRENARNRIRRILLGITGISLIVALWWFLNKFPYAEYYGNFTTINGWPVGLGEKAPRPNKYNNLVVRYKLTRKGVLPQKWKGNPFYKVEVLDAHDSLAYNMWVDISAVELLESELDDNKAALFAQKQMQTAYWIFSSNNIKKESASKRIAYDKGGNILYSVQYYSNMSSNDDIKDKRNGKETRWAVFLDPSGKQMEIRDNGIDRVMQTVNNGIVTSERFFTTLGVPQTNGNNVYGYNYITDSGSHFVTSRTTVDKFGRPIEGTTIKYTDWEYGRNIKNTNYCTRYEKNRVILNYNQFNDTIEYFKNGKLHWCNYHPNGDILSQRIIKYDSLSRIIEKCNITNNILVEKSLYSYINKSFKTKLIERFDTINGRYSEKYNYSNNNRDSVKIVSCWRGNNPICIWQRNEYGEDYLSHKRIETKEVKGKYIFETTELRDTSDNLLDSIHFIGDALPSPKWVVIKDKGTRYVLMEYYLDSKDNVLKSEWNEYDEYGNRVARAVAGIDGTPIRYPDWDWEGFCYYKMNLIMDFRGETYVAAEAENELGQKTDIYANDSIFEIAPLSPTMIVGSLRNERSVVKIFGYQISKSTNKWEKQTMRLPYIHLISVGGRKIFQGEFEIPKNRLRDGDIPFQIGEWRLSRNIGDSGIYLKQIVDKICKNGGAIKVIRVINGEYKVVDVIVNANNIIAEIFVAPISQKEYNYLKNIL